MRTRKAEPVPFSTPAPGPRPRGLLRPAPRSPGCRGPLSGTHLPKGTGRADELPRCHSSVSSQAAEASRGSWGREGPPKLSPLDRRGRIPALKGPRPPGKRQGRKVLSKVGSRARLCGAHLGRDCPTGDAEARDRGLEVRKDGDGHASSQPRQQGRCVSPHDSLVIATMGGTDGQTRLISSEPHVRGRAGSEPSRVAPESLGASAPVCGIPFWHPLPGPHTSGL